MTTTDPFAGLVAETPHTSATLRAEYFRKAKRGYGVVRHGFVQKQQGTVGPRASTLAQFVNGKQLAALDVYLLLLALEPVVVESPESLQVWTKLLGDTANAATTANAFKVLQRWGLVHRESGRTQYLVTPFDETGAKNEEGSPKEYQRPTGTSDFGERYFSIPEEFWTEGFVDRLKLPGKAMMLVLLAETSRAGKPAANVPSTQVRQWYGFSERTAERGYEELVNQRLIRQHVTYERDPNSPIKVRPAVYRAFNEPFDTDTRLKRQAKAARATKKKSSSVGSTEGSKSAPALGSKEV